MTLKKKSKIKDILQQAEKKYAVKADRLLRSTRRSTQRSKQLKISNQPKHSKRDVHSNQPAHFNEDLH
jgi:hypothetical protein